MSAAKPQPAGWNRGRFLLLAAALFAGQAGLVLLFAERSHPVTFPAARRTEFRLLRAALSEEEVAKYVFASDPTVFTSSSSHGFAGQAWGHLRPAEYNLPARAESPTFLEFAVNRLGGNLIPAGQTSSEISLQLAGLQGAPLDATPVSPVTEAVPPDSFLQIAGPLAARQLGRSGSLRSWGVDGFLSHSVIQFAINRAGVVESARVVAGSGLTEADQYAVGTVNGLRFSPARNSPDELAWDEATFYWKTVAPLLATNAPASVVPGVTP